MFLPPAPRCCLRCRWCLLLALGPGLSEQPVSDSTTAAGVKHTAAGQGSALSLLTLVGIEPRSQPVVSLSPSPALTSKTLFCLRIWWGPRQGLPCGPGAHSLGVQTFGGCGARTGAHGGEHSDSDTCPGIAVVLICAPRRCTPTYGPHAWFCWGACQDGGGGWCPTL